ncbi:MAG TPA: hypothetical protein VGF55_07490 [Gemmataceae bacterium]|jgi:hypothetical protein
MTPFTAPAPPRRRRLRFVVIALGLVALAAAAVAGWLVYRHARIGWQLRDAIAELDAADPRWRLEQIEADRAKVPDAENSSPVIRHARALLGRPPLYAYQLRDELLRGLTPEVRLTDAQYAGLIDVLEDAEAGVGPALALVRYPRGRHPITYAADGVSTLLRHADDMSSVHWRVLEPLTLVLAHEGDAAGALTACHATLNLGRSIGDEPFAVSQLVRARYSRSAVRGLERVLGQGEAPADVLAVLQAELAAEADYDPWDVVLRGERAVSFQVMEALQTGVLKPSMFRALARTTPGAAARRSEMDKAREWLADRFGVDTRAALAWRLRHMTRLKDAGRLPWPERRAAVAALAEEEADAPELARPLLWLTENFITAVQAAQARCRCAAVAIAVELYRLRHGRWPDSLAALVPDFLPAAPLDPLDGRPLRYKRLAHGVAVYSVGPDGADDGGHFVDDQSWPAGTDVGVRLWDVNHRGRRRAAAPGGPP